MKEIEYGGFRYRVTGEPISRCYVAVPHQRPAYIVYAEASPPNEEDGDQVIEGDHDLHCVHEVATIEDVARLMQATSGGGKQTRHQSRVIASAVRREMIGQGVIEPIEEDAAGPEQNEKSV
jgi:hypothetical protein